MTSSVVKLHDFTKPDKNPAQGLLGIVTEAQLSIRKHRYHEASDILAMAQHVDKGKAELRIARAFLEIRCQMALSNLEKAHYAWQDLEEIFLRHPQMNNSEAMLLGARLHWAHGDITGALQCSKKARSLSRNSRDLILSQTALARTDLYLRGSAATALEELMPIWSALKVDCSFSENSKDLSSQLKRTLILAALTQGKLHLAQSLAEKVETLRSVLDLELHVLTGIISIFAGETNLAIRAAQDIDLVQLKDGSSRQEYGSLAWWQSIIYHAAGLEKEAYRKAEDYHELITALGTSTQPSELQPYADALLASCLIQRKGITRASQLTGKYMNDSVLSAPIKAMITLCEALIIYETEGLRKSKSLLRKQKGQVFNQDSIMAVGLMCYAHKNLLTLLCKCFSVEQLPPKLTDLLDSEAFQAKYAFTEKQLQQGESAKLHK
ncbi:MAG: hypothetical protein FWE48_02805, partial [Coriobacteriia bacterium]|nr:hypothetical protein [Coriobacteriia bacterium]